jgi:hypothetical protein
MAGEGSSGERGFRPLSYSVPPLEQISIRVYGLNLFERGIQGVSINEQPDANNTNPTDTGNNQAPIAHT